MGCTKVRASKAKSDPQRFSRLTGLNLDMLKTTPGRPCGHVYLGQQCTIDDRKEGLHPAAEEILYSRCHFLNI